MKTLSTRKGTLTFPAFFPVTTFGAKYPLDQLIQPFLRQLAPAVMVSAYFLRDQTSIPNLGIPMMVDSGGFASIFQDARIVRTKEGLGTIHYQGEVLHPRAVLELQERFADIACTLDFLIPPGLPLQEAKRRQRLTLNNALWARQHRRRQDLPLYGVVQAWDAPSARALTAEYVQAGFEGIALGGLVPRLRSQGEGDPIINAVLEEAGQLPVHALGIGHPDHVARLRHLGVDSVDSSSYVKFAADGRSYATPQHRTPDATPHERLHLALCNLAAATGASLPLSSAPQFRTLTTQALLRAAQG